MTGIWLVALAVIAIALPCQAQDAELVDSYLSIIDEIEARDGAYGADLSEPLLGLATALNARGQFADAIPMFKRGVHLARINDGLYSASQLPHLEGEIAAHIGVGNYAEADERYRYLYRVQKRTLGNTDAYTRALLDHADWDFRAYQLGLDDDPYARLLRMQKRYDQALANISQNEQANAESLLAPMRGLLRTRYLIANYDGEAMRQTLYADEFTRQQRLREFEMNQLRNYEYGRDLILHMYKLQQALVEHQGYDAATPAQSLARLGDWHLYHGKRFAALEAYNAALAELAALDDAQQQTARLFAEPVALPSIDGLLALPQRLDSTTGDVMIEFSVSSRGQVYDIERIDDNEAFDRTASSLTRQLRKTRFRPRFADGQPVETTDIVYAYDIQ